MPNGVDHVKNGLVDVTDGGPTIFAVVLAPVLDLDAPKIEKDSCGILKRDAVPMQIVRGFGRVPFEIHGDIVESVCSYIKFRLFFVLSLAHTHAALRVKPARQGPE